MIDFDTLAVAFGKAVRTRRESLGLSQRAFARRLGMEQGAISAIEKAKYGHKQGPRLATIEKYAAALGTTAAELVPEIAAWGKQ